MCRECGHESGTFANYTRHWRVHTGERLQCEICLKCKLTIFDQIDLSAFFYVSRRLRKKQRSLGFSTMSDTNQTVELEKKARRLKFQIYHRVHSKRMKRGRNA